MCFRNPQQGRCLRVCLVHLALTTDALWFVGELPHPHPAYLHRCELQHTVAGSKPCYLNGAAPRFTALPCSQVPPPAPCRQQRCLAVPLISSALSPHPAPLAAVRSIQEGPRKPFRQLTAAVHGQSSSAMSAPDSLPETAGSAAADSLGLVQQLFERRLGPARTLPHAVAAASSTVGADFRSVANRVAHYFVCV